MSVGGGRDHDWGTIRRDGVTSRCKIERALARNRRREYEPTRVEISGHASILIHGDDSRWRIAAGIARPAAPITPIIDALIHKSREPPIQETFHGAVPGKGAARTKTRMGHREGPVRGNEIGRNGLVAVHGHRQILDRALHVARPAVKGEARGRVSENQYHVAVGMLGGPERKGDAARREQDIKGPRSRHEEGRNGAVTIHHDTDSATRGVVDTVQFSLPAIEDTSGIRNRRHERHREFGIGIGTGGGVRGAIAEGSKGQVEGDFIARGLGCRCAASAGQAGQHECGSQDGLQARKGKHSAYLRAAK